MDYFDKNFKKVKVQELLYSKIPLSYTQFTSVIIIIAIGKCVDSIIDLIGVALKTVSYWTKEKGLGVNPSKVDGITI